MNKDNKTSNKRRSMLNFLGIGAIVAAFPKILGANKKAQRKQAAGNPVSSIKVNLHPDAISRNKRGGKR